MRTVRPSLFVLAWMVAVGPFGDTEVTPALPRMAEAFGAPYSAVQLTMTTYLAGYALAQLFYGPLSDKYGRRPVMLVGASLLVLGSLLCAVSPTLPFLLAARVVQGVGACAGGVIVFAAVRDAWPDEERGRVYARINLAYALAPGAGPFVGGLLGPHVGWRASMVAVLVLGGVMLVLVWARFKETLVDKHETALQPATLARTARTLLGNRDFRVYAWQNGAAVGIVYACLAEAPALARALDMFSFFFFALIAIGVAGAFAAGSLAGGRLTARWPGDRVSLLGIIAVIVGALALGAAAWAHVLTIWTTLFPIMFVFFGIALIVPSVTAGAMKPFGTIAGSASAMLGALQMGIASLSTLATSVLHHRPDATMAIVFLALAVPSLVVHLAFLERAPRRASPA